MASPTPPTIRPARQLALMAARLVASSLHRVNHEQSTPMVRSQTVTGTQKNYPSVIRWFRLLIVSQAANPISAAPKTAAAKRLALVPLTGESDIGPRLEEGSG